MLPLTAGETGGSRGLQLVSDQAGMVCCGFLFLFLFTFGCLSLGTLSLRRKIMAAFSQHLS